MGAGVAARGSGGGTGAERVVQAVVDIPARSLTALPLQLSAIAGSRTVAARFDGFEVPDSRVTHLIDLADWLDRDGAGVPAIDPAVLGVAAAAIGYARDRHPDDPNLPEISAEIDRLWEVARAAAPAPNTELHDGRSRLYWRTTATALAVRATQAAIVAAGGSGLRADHITQVWARAALFYQVRGVNSAMRAEHFARLAGK
ncbi:hypothetical protein ABZ894_18400 [Nocardia beijingensis]|uniref:hypothetical protein n=1 Tax=Nocardia beijingensis TaxID=95162 RepID=UPI0033D8C3B0